MRTGQSDIAMERLNVKKDTFVFREGDAGDAAYVVDLGSIAIIKTVEGSDMRLATVNQGGMFGEMAILDGSPRMASAQAIEDSTLIVVLRHVSNRNSVGPIRPCVRCSGSWSRICATSITPISSARAAPGTSST
jgi:hypothetical protein